MSKFVKLIIVGLLSLPLFISAAGRSVIRPGDTLTLEPQSNISAPQWHWQLKDNAKIIRESEERNFKHTFPEAGLFEIEVSAKNRFNEIQKSNVIVEVDAAKAAIYSSSLSAKLTTLPHPGADGRVIVSPEQPFVVFYAGGSKGSIAQFGIDLDVNNDSDADGNPGNDFANRDHKSFKDGGMWPVVFDSLKEGESTTVRLTVIDQNGVEKQVEQEIVVQHVDSTGQPLKAIIGHN